MLSMPIIFLGLALAMDAAVVTFAVGLLNAELPVSHKILRGLIISSVFGLFQFLMLWLGSYGGFIFTFSSYGYLFQIVVAMVFFLISAKFYHESIDDEDRDLQWGIVPLLILGFATSIDALAAGISLGTLPLAHMAAGAVGVITFFSCAAFYALSMFFKNIPEKWLLRFACLIFLGLGVNSISGHIQKFWAHL